ncbi:hypothetical protein ACV30B_06810 [Clostridium perfringens]
MKFIIKKSKGKQNNTTNSLASSVITITILLVPFFSQYASNIPGISLGDIIIGIAMIVALFSSRFKIILGKIKYFILIWGFGGITTLITMIVQRQVNIDVITRYMRFSFYVIAVILAIQLINKERAIHYLKIFCALLASYIILQTLVYYTTGIMLPFKILNIPWMSGSLMNNEYALYIATKYYYRPSGIFIEPGYAAQYLLMGFAFSLYGSDENKKVDIKLAILIFLGLLLSTSSQGVFIGIILIVYKIIDRLKSNNANTQKGWNIVIVIFMAIVLLLVFQTDMVQSSLNKITEEVRGGSSASVRLYRGFAVFLKLPTLFKLIGVGHGNLGNFVLRNDIYTKYDPEIMTLEFAEYANGFSLILLYYGIFIAMAFMYFLYRTYKNSTGAFRMLVIIQVILAFVSGAFVDSSIVTFFPLIFMECTYKSKT